jgi:hypothetical protein
VCGPPLTQVRGWRGDQLILQVGGRGEDWKVDGCSLSTQNNGARGALILGARGALNLGEVR